MLLASLLFCDQQASFRAEELQLFGLCRSANKSPSVMFTGIIIALWFVIGRLASQSVTTPECYITFRVFSKLLVFVQ